MNLQEHLEHLRKASPKDQLELLQRVAALAWNRGRKAGLEESQTDSETPNPFSLT